MAPPGTYPIQRAMFDLVIGGDRAPSPAATPATDEWLRRLASLPLMCQPGERWMYNTGSDVLGVLIGRASGMSFESFLCQRIFEPLGMKDTAFYVPAEKVDRLAGCYRANPETGGLEVYDDPRRSEWRVPPAFATGGGGLVSTADDFLAFGQMMLNKGAVGRERIVSRLSVELMTTDQLTPAQKIGTEPFFGADQSSWGFGMRVVTRRDDLSAVPGRFGWEGGFGTTAYVDPTEQLVGILLTQRMMTSPVPPPAFVDFWTSAYQAIDD
jgi:CubicO group peptidase (beta-lactamase class C family)